ncbi:hypothetical protein COV11_03750 [Candidatus Woesearchaeota archaeon CG10_big_fil_rev_8_21_14_0_10_30_7]|nr:MAG: hypothetical protein COV11_03750 [Candidatus Woesearchaeota archaeon CG10_big_fil_rev_8_21_14_0_10_30_7]
MSLDETHLIDAQNGVLCMNQSDFINFFNSVGRIMVSMPDLYEAGKSASKKTLESLRKDFRESWVITSTRIDYEPDSLDATITHYFGSNVVIPNVIKVLIPKYSSNFNLNNVLNTDEGLAFLQAFFNTEDDAETIKTTLNKLSNYESNNSCILTSDQNSRQSNPTSASGLDCSDVRFHVDVDVIVNTGRSRGVLDNPAGVALENRVVGKDNSVFSVPFELNDGINKKARCVYFTNVQMLGNLAKYSGLFCFNGERFVIDLIIPKKDVDGWDDQISKILSENHSTDKKIGCLECLSPLYVHLLRYEKQNESYVLVDDVEAFGKPRIRGLQNV